MERGLEKLRKQNYDDWSMLVKLCFDEAPQSKLSNQKRPSNEGSSSYYDSIPSLENNLVVNVGSVELMRFHPFFNKLSYYGVKDFLNGCRLVKLRPNQLLYR